MESSLKRIGVALIELEFVPLGGLKVEGPHVVQVDVDSALSSKNH